MSSDMFKNTDGKKKNNPVVIISSIVLLLILSLGLAYNRVTEKIVNNNVEVMKEISLHDKNAVEHSIVNRLELLHVIGQELEKSKPASMQEAQLILQDQLVYLKDAENLLLLDESGTTYKNSGLIEKDDVVKEYCDVHAGEFAVRYNRMSEIYEMNRERLMMAVPVNITIDGTHITNIVGLMDIESIKDELKIDSYEGKGYSSIIDRDGNYIVNINDMHILYTYDNFFEDMKDANVKGYASVQKFVNDIESLSDIEETVSAQYEINGTDYAVTIAEIPSTDWYFLTNVPMSVFRGQSNAIMAIFAMLVAAIMIVFVGLGYTILRNRRQYLQLKVAEEREKNTKIIEKQNAELEKALAMAESASRAKTIFLNNMSHDIRTPMNAIIGYTGMAKTHIDNKEQVQNYLSKIDKSSNHLLSLINDVLDMSRIESGKMTLNEKAESLSEIVHTLRDIVLSDIRAKNMELFIDVDSIQDETVICDKLRLNQVLLNIVSNAIKYTQSGGSVSLYIKQDGVDDEGRGKYEFRVKDNGMGMSAEFLTTIFDPFTRVNSSTVSGIQGTGLGMAITKNIVNLMGGTITVESEEKKGTEVILNFSFKIADESVIRHKEEEKYDFAGKKILLVEDNEMNREIATDILEEVGFVIDTAEDGTIAVEKVKNSKPGDYDLILMDVQMPIMDGYEATRQIRAIDDTQLSNITIIAMTANAFEEDRTAAIESGMNEHISKPIDIKRLKSVLARCLKS